MPEVDAGTSLNKGAAGGAVGAACEGMRRMLAAPASAPSCSNPRLGKVITFILARVGLVGLHYPDTVIGEFVVGSRQLDSRHVAGGAVLLGTRPSLGSRLGHDAGLARAGIATRMARQAFRVEVHLLGIGEVVVRVV